MQSGIASSSAGSVWDERMRTDHLKGGVKVKLLNAATDVDDFDADHLPHSPIPRLIKKPPVPIRQIRRKTWNPPHSPNDNSDTKTSSSDQITAKSTSPSLRKTRSEVNKVVGDTKTDSSSSSPRLLRKVKSTPSKYDGSAKSARLAIIEDADSGHSSKMPDVEKLNDETSFEKMTTLMDKEIYGSDECQEKLITSSSDNVNGNECIDADRDKEEIEEDENPVEEEEIEKEKKSYDVKEVSVPDYNSNKVEQDGHRDEDVKVCQISDKKAAAAQTALVVKQPLRATYIKRSAFYSDLNKSGHLVTKATTSVVKPSRSYSKPVSKFTKPSPSFTEPADSPPHEFQRHPATPDRLQSLVDLVMWRDVSRSAFVFGTGTFMIISSSYTQDLNISFISITSYFGLAYLALVFLFRSTIHRGVTYVDNDIIVGEEEAIWIVKLVLPYVNEFILSLRGLFSGDPATTMKLAVVLFVLARCGSSITIWKMAKLGFIGAFTGPKIVSSYSVQLKTQCKFWIGRFRDAWDTCTHKKIIAGIVFSLIWNLCSIVARIWALFMVAVAFRYYQQLLAVDEEREEEEVVVDEGRQKEQGGRVEDTDVESIKKKKQTYIA
ncbi:unnamed protein product [Rhodiola kirilowii]